MRRVAVFFLLIIFFTNSILLPARSNEDLDKNNITDQTTLKGNASVNDVLPRNTKLKIIINQNLDGLENKIGDEFNATVLNDVNVNDTNLIPVGSLIVGRIEEIMHAGKASMQGTMEIALDKILLPSGRYIPLNGAKFASDKQYTNKSRNLKGEGNGLARNVGLSALKGATLTFIPGSKFVKSAALGVAATGAVFSGGWSVTSTAVIGGLTGLIHGVKKHGKEVMIASGQEFEIVLDGEQDLTPVELVIDDIMNQGVQTTDSNETIIK